MIPRDFIDTLLARVDIVDVVDRRVPLKKAGQNYQACCPFHQEKTPSFTVSPSKQFYHCFGCGAHGSAIGFLMEYEGLGFVEAVEALAADAGLAVPQEAGTASGPRPGADLYDLMSRAARYYREQLKAAPRAIAYLQKRGLTGAIAARYGLGYAPPALQGLAGTFADYQRVELASVGLVIDDERGRRDRLRDRIMFPIRDGRGRIVGFGGRVLDQGEPKYLNSPETPLFSKGSEVYGLYEARAAIRAANRVLVTEGYMDTVALAQFGIDYAVATLGTATTPVHARLLLRQAERVYYCFDGDSAGRKAAWRALENTLEALTDGKEVFFLFLPEGEDPDSYVRARGVAAFEAFVAGGAVPLSAYLVRQLVGDRAPQTAEARARVLKQAQPLLAKLGAPILARLVRQELGLRLGLSEREGERLLGRTAPRRAAAPAPAQGLYRQLARLLAWKPSWAAQIDPHQVVQGEPYAGLLTDLLAWLPGQASKTPAQLLEAARGAPMESELQALLGEAMEWGEGFDAAEEFAGARRRLFDLWRRRRIEVLSAQAVLSEAEGRELLELLRSAPT